MMGAWQVNSLRFLRHRLPFGVRAVRPGGYQDETKAHRCSADAMNGEFHHLIILCPGTRLKGSKVDGGTQLFSEKRFVHLSTVSGSG
jgi:hypothetical protein